MAGPYQRLSNGQSADSGAQAITTVVNAMQDGLEDAEAALAAKAAASHTHAEGDVTGLASALAGKAASSHSHSGSDITSGTVPIARIPTGTSSTTVSLGNHTHTVSGSDGYSRVYVEDYGAVADGGASWVLTTSAASTTVSVTVIPYLDVTFRASDVGKTIRISPVDFATASVSRTITAVAGDGKSCTISSAPGFTSSQAVADWGGTDNTSAIQSAIDDADGRTVCFGPGVYRVTGALSIPAGTKMEGVGWGMVPYTATSDKAWQHADGTTIQLSRGVDTHLLSAGTRAANVRIARMRLVGSTEGATTKNTVNADWASGSYTDYASHWDIDECYVVGGRYSVYFHWVSVGKIIGGEAGLSRSHAVYYDNAPDGYLDRASCIPDTDSSSSAARSCLYLGAGSDHTVVDGGYYQWGAFGITVASDGNTINGPRLTDQGDTGIKVTGNYNVVNGGNVKTITGITSGYTSGNKYGVHITGNKNTVMGCGTTDASGRMAKGHAITGTADGNVIIPGASTTALLNTASGTNTVIVS